MMHRAGLRPSRSHDRWMDGVVLIGTTTAFVHAALFLTMPCAVCQPRRPVPGQTANCSLSARLTYTLGPGAPMRGGRTRSTGRSRLLCIILRAGGEEVERLEAVLRGALGAEDALLLRCHRES